MISKIKLLLFPGDKTYQEISKRNINIIFYLSIISIFARLINIIEFNALTVGNEIALIWKNNIINMHQIYLMIWILTLVYATLAKFTKLKNKKNVGFQLITFLSIISLGMLASLFDQLVSPNMTPYVIGSFAGVILLIMHPFMSVISLLTNYIVFSMYLPMFQSDIEIVASNRANAITMMLLSIFLSIVMYRYFVINEKQKRFIKIQRKELEYFANTDSLTNLMNRRHFIEKTKNIESSAVLVAIDIDDFKKINDQYGHPIGDKMLQKFSIKLVEYFGENALISRFGGEEFLIMLEKNVCNDIAEYLDIFRNQIEHTTFLIDYHKIQITISLGYSKKSAYESTYYDAYKRADKALYKAKNSGKNMVYEETI